MLNLQTPLTFLKNDNKRKIDQKPSHFKGKNDPFGANSTKEPIFIKNWRKI